MTCRTWVYMGIAVPCLFVMFAQIDAEDSFSSHTPDRIVLHERDMNLRVPSSVPDVRAKGMLRSADNFPVERLSGRSEGNFPGDRRRTVLLMNGSADDSFSFSFYPEAELSFSDYNLKKYVSNPSILNSNEDIELSVAESGIAVNISVNVEFGKRVGTTNVTLDFERQNGTVFQTLNMEYLVAGFQFVKDDPIFGDTVVSGSDHSLHFDDYSTFLDGYSYVELGGEAQFLNGSSSSALPNEPDKLRPSLSFGMDNIDIIVSNAHGLVQWDSDRCQLMDAVWDGERVQVHDGCGLGLVKTEASLTEPSRIILGIYFEEYRSGSLELVFEWDRFTEGTEFEGELLSTNLVVSVGGTPPAVVNLIRPTEEFSTSGNQDLYVEMINARNISIKFFDVELVSTPFPLRPGSYKELTGPFGDYESAIFRTTPGTGKMLNWKIVATRTNGTRNLGTGREIVFPVHFVDRTGYLFSYDNREVSIEAVLPLHFREEGGDQVIVRGSFGDFNNNDADGVILLSNRPLNSSTLGSSNLTRITFTSPARVDVGNAWSYDLQIRIGSSFSNPVTISYVPVNPTITITLFGGSLEEKNGYHVFGNCSSISARAVSNGPEFEENNFEWFLYAPSGTELLSLSNTSLVEKRGSSLSMDVSVLPDVEVLYRLVAKFSNEHMNAIAETFVKATKALKIGVTIVDPAVRTISNPVTGLRVIAKIDMPRCGSFNGLLAYSWEFGNDTESSSITTVISSSQPLASKSSAREIDFYKKASYTNYKCIASQDSITPEGAPGTLRLCRELLVPREDLAVGVHKIRLRVFEAERGGVSMDDFIPLRRADGSYQDGWAVGVARIRPDDIVAIIRQGETSITVNGENDIEMSGAQSYDPDSLADYARMNLTYSWNCKFYWEGKQPENCTDELLNLDDVNSQKFTVSSKALVESLGRIPQILESVYIMYSLAVSKGDRRSDAVQVVEVTRRSSVSQLAASSVRIRKSSMPKRNERRLGLQMVSHASSTALSSKRSQLHDHIAFKNGGGQLVKPREVKFWEELIVSPVVDTELRSATSWKFELIEPRIERNTFFISNKLISRPGYYSKRSFNEFSTLPLGIRENALRAHTTYLFRVVFWFQGENEQVESSTTFDITTVELPQLIFPVLSTTRGSMDTAIRITARTNMEDESAYLFQFYIADEKNRLEEFCVDGCTGAPVAVFKTHRAGNYTVHARLLAANGKTILRSVRNDKILEIVQTGAPPNSDQYLRTADTDFQLGDDGNVNIRGFLVSAALTDDNSEMDGAGVVALSDSGAASLDHCLKLAPHFVQRTLQITRKEQPTTASLKNTILIAVKYASLSCLEDEGSLYDLLHIVNSALGRTPPENTLQLETLSRKDDVSQMGSPDIVLEIQRFYNYTITRAVSGLLAKGSSRRRLAPIPGSVSNLILDLYEKWREHVITVSTSDKVCGYERSVSTELPSGLGDPAVMNLQTEARSIFFGSNTVHVAVRCNSENGLSLQGSFSTFEWCSSVFDPTSQDRKLASLAEMYDYVYLSGIQGENRTDSKVLVAVNITVLGRQNQLVPALTDVSVYGTGSNSETSDSPLAQRLSACYSIGMRMDEIAIKKLVADESAVVDQSSQERKQESVSAYTANPQDSCKFKVFTMWPLKRYGQSYSSPFQDSAYMRRTDGIYEELSTGQTNSSFVTVKTAHLGLYGAVRLGCSNSLLPESWDLNGTLISLIVLIFGILLLVAIVSILTYVLATTILAGESGPSEAAVSAEAWVERDYFGRGDVRLARAEKDTTDTDVESEGNNVFADDGEESDEVGSADSALEASNEISKRKDGDPSS